MSDKRTEEGRAMRLVIDNLAGINGKLDDLQADMQGVKTEVALSKVDRADIRADIVKHEHCLYGNGRPGLIKEFAELKRDAQPWLNRGHKLTDWLLGLVVLGAVCLFAFLKTR